MCGVCQCGGHLGSPGCHICLSHFAVSIRSRLADDMLFKTEVSVLVVFSFQELENVCFS